MRLEGNDKRGFRLIVGGGIGSGKSTVLRMMEQRGVVVIEADRIGHEILEPDGAAFAAVAARWPEVVVVGRVDRPRLAAIVFADTEQLRALEAISHPLIAAEIGRRVEAAGGDDVALELPLNADVVGSGWLRLAVVAPRNQRLERAIDRGMDGADVSRRIDAQPDREAWIDAADFVIENSGSLLDLEAAVDRVVATLRA